MISRRLLPLAIVSAIAVAGCPDFGGAPLFESGDAATADGDDAASATQPMEHIVTLKALSFCDQTDCSKISKIRIGDTITWVNQDTAFHEIVYGDPQTPGTELFHSPAIQIGERWSFTFTQAGDYEYYCNNHKRLMNMAHIVVAP